MAIQRLMLDTSILIDYLRKTDKRNARLVAHFKAYDELYISSITEFELINGATEVHVQFWDGMLQNISVIEFGSKEARQAAAIIAGLRKKRKSIDIPDLFIAATAIANGHTLDTLNLKHFNIIDDLSLLTY